MLSLKGHLITQFQYFVNLTSTITLSLFQLTLIYSQKHLILPALSKLSKQYYAYLFYVVYK